MPSVMFSSKFLTPPNSSSNFGIFQLKTEQQESKFKEINWVLNVDRSGSMQDMCPDGKTKMEHTHHTLKNMVDYFIKLNRDHPTIKQYITIIAFDHEAIILCDCLEITESAAGTIATILDTLEPRGATNIGDALSLADEHIRGIIEKYPADDADINVRQISHLFMSDGNITVGIQDIDILKAKCYDRRRAAAYNITNTFIGFGTHHDANLMRKLGDISKGAYYFVESLENAGMVYGEILYKSLYEYIQNLRIRVDNGDIYNYETNTWGKILTIDAVSSGQTRTWHIRTISDDTSAASAAAASASAASASAAAASASASAASASASASAASASAAQDDETSEMIQLPVTIVVAYKLLSENHITSKEIHPDYPPDGEIDSSVEKYMWRQRTQEIMSEVNEFINKPPVPAQLYPGAGGNIFVKPALRHNALAPADKYLTEEHQILDMAKAGEWILVSNMLNKMPHLVNCLPHPRRYGLIHHAVHQQNVKALETIMNRGANAEMPTSDGETAQQIIEKSTSRIIRTAMIELLNYIIPVKTTRTTNKEFEQHLNEFMLEMKDYMEKNNLIDDVFMNNLCDDIYVCTKSLTASKNLGNMYLNTRSASQGAERAYNIGNFRDLDAGSKPVDAAFRGLSQHTQQHTTQTPYAPPRAATLMRAVSCRR